ncbi:MAG TPA: PilZ domain-containing protein [Polyangia bacterium]
MTRHLDSLERLDLRNDHRVAVESLCTEIVGEREQLSMVVDLSENGLRLQRPLGGRVESHLLQIEFELPEVDELVWAKGVICFDQLWRVPAGFGHARRGRLVRTSGVRVVAAATRHLRMLREYVVARSAMRARRAPGFAPVPLPPVPADRPRLAARPGAPSAYVL